MSTTIWTLRGGTIVDGTGGAPRTGSVIVEGDVFANGHPVVRDGMYDPQQRAGRVLRRSV